MAQRRGKSQARRHGGNSGLPGWAWLVLGVALTLGAILVAPKFLGNGEGDGFFRPKANPDAQPLSSRDGEGGDDLAADAPRDGADSVSATGKAPAADADYDFYDLLPGEEVAMTDAQLAAAAREEAARAQRERERAAAQASGDPASAATRPQPLPEDGGQPANAPPAAPTQVASATPPPAAAGNDTPYVLQAGAFGASGDAEAVKAKIALLGLNARVESAQIAGRTVYRVRMGPYGTASELAVAKGKLGSGGMPAMAIKAK